MRNSLIAVLLLTSVPAFANEAADELMNRTSLVSERARAEVKTETIAARHDGTLTQNDYILSMKQGPRADSRARADVRAEAVKAARLRVIQEL